MHLFSLLELPTQHPTRGPPSIITTHVEPTWSTVFYGADGQQSTRVSLPTHTCTFGQSYPPVFAGSGQRSKPQPKSSFASQYLLFFLVFISPPSLPLPFFTGRLGSGTTPSPSDTIRTNPSRRSYDFPHVHVRPLTPSQLLL